MTDDPAASLTFADIEAAAKLMRGSVVCTPLVYSGALSAMTGAEIYLKLETLQRTGSFKDRGAFVKLSSLSEAQRKAGVIAISAGNHAQGVAYHAKRLGASATIVMPAGTPFTKVSRTQSHGARVILRGDTIDASQDFARDLAEAEGLTLVHPYDDPKIVAGQGVIALEMLADAPDLETLVIPIGGGGLIGGVGLAAKQIKPSIQIVGVEAALYPSMYQSLNGLPVQCGGDTIAEGIAVKTPGALNIALARRFVDDLVLLDEPSLEHAVQTMLETGKLVAEGAGAAPLAAVLADPARFAGKKVGVIVCGANIDSRIMAGVLMRGMARAHRLARIRVGIADAPGALSKVASQIGETGANIVEVMHQRMFYDVPVKQASLDIMIETRDESHIHDVLARLQAAGYTAKILSESEAG
ncbi:MAG: threonine ammonia-lyase [Alphaproteobacteria bacterium]|nr:threonine ammonia-lyase [Alphaproteobacteria bacterium]